MAKLGEWDFISKYKVARKGSIKVTTTVDITHVPDMTSSDLDMVEFTAYDGRVEATPFQLVSISGSDASTEEVYSNSWYETKGYVGFEAGGLSLNYYFTQKIAFAGNTGSKRNKINVSMKVGV